MQALPTKCRPFAHGPRRPREHLRCGPCGRRAAASAIRSISSRAVHKSTAPRAVSRQIAVFSLLPRPTNQIEPGASARALRCGPCGRRAAASAIRSTWSGAVHKSTAPPRGLPTDRSPARRVSPSMALRPAGRCVRNSLGWSSAAARSPDGLPLLSPHAQRSCHARQASAGAHLAGRDRIVVGASRRS
jgi:hypothetical protein